MQVEGAQLRHYPDTDTLEIDGVRIRAVAADGRVTLAHGAQRALANGDASEVQLLGGAAGDAAMRGGEPRSSSEGEFLHAFLRTEQLRSHLPVQLRAGQRARFARRGIEYDHLSRSGAAQGAPVRAVFVRSRASHRADQH